jgi:FkbH-like protein
MLNPVRHWIGSFPQSQQIAILEAVESGSLPQIRRALRLIDELHRQYRGRSLNVEVLSTFNLEPLLPVLQFALNCIPSQAQVELGPLDDIEGHITRSSGVSPGCDARLVVWRVEEVLPEVLYPFSCGFPEQVVARVDRLVERVDRLVVLHQHCSPGVPLFISTVPIPVHAANAVLAAQHSAGPFASISRVNQHIYEVATRNDGVYVLDLASWAALTGKGYADVTLDFFARQPLSGQAQIGFAFFIARNLRPLIVPRRKVLALDLDNTLWGGVIGEDGVNGVILGHDFPGYVYLRIQRELLELRHQGVLLVILSKNNEADARQAFESLPDMILKWDDFVVRKINWGHKYENLRDAARELGLGLDSFVFIDDSHYECEQMRQFLPEVLILNESRDALQLLKAIWETDAFDSLILTDEDRRRHQDYAVRDARNVQIHHGDLESFLRSLEMEAMIEPVQSSNLERVVTMLGKTNQFNVTTRRHSRTQVQAMLQSRGTIALALRLRDKFGDQGIVAVLLAFCDSDQSMLKVDSFLVSCRALGRGVEDALWAATLERARQQEVRRLEAEYIATAKNAIVAELYDRLGLQRVRHDNRSIYYCLEPITAPVFPSWIRVG